MIFGTARWRSYGRQAGAGSPAKPTGFSKGLLGSMSRGELLAGLCILGCANGLADKVVKSIDTVGLTEAAVGTFGISAIVWLACLAGIALVIRDRRDAVRPLDLAVGAGFLVLVILPISTLSWLAMTGLGLYMLLLAEGHSARRRGAVILLAMTVPMLWSRVLFQLFANLILELDASMVGLLLRADRVGNVVRLVDGSGYFVILPACSSLANMSLAFLCWVTVSQWVGHQWSLRDAAWGCLACGSVVTVNVVRLCLMGLSQENFDMLHSQLGDTATNVIALGLAVGFSLAGVRHELLSRA